MLKGKFNLDTFEGLFKAKMPPLIGADISSSAIKMVEIESAGKGMYRVERYAIEPLPKDSVLEGNVNNLDAVSDAMRRCHKRLGSNIKNLALALPNAAVISKRILVPAGQTEEDLALQVETEANQYIPFALEEVNLDFQVLGPAPNSPEDVEVLIAASRNSSRRARRRRWLERGSRSRSSHRTDFQLSWFCAVRPAWRGSRNVSLSPTADWQFRHTPEKSKRWTERRGGGLGRNEGEAE